MLKVLNILPEVGPQSETQGWKVDIKTREDGKNNYRVVLEGSDTNINLAIDRNDYEKLTTPFGVDPNAESRLISLTSAKGAYRPILTGIKNGHEDELVVLFNFETEVGDVITDIRLQNMFAVTYHIRKINDRSAVTAMLVADNYDELSSISIDYGRIGGKTQLTQTIAFDPLNARRSQLGYQFIKDTNIIESGIKTKKIQLPKLDLSSICVNK